MNSTLLKTAIDDAGLTQAAIAAEMGISRTNINRWVTGSRNPRIDTILKILSICGWSKERIGQIRLGELYNIAVE